MELWISWVSCEFLKNKEPHRTHKNSSRDLPVNQEKGSSELKFSSDEMFNTKLDWNTNLGPGWFL